MPSDIQEEQESDWNYLLFDEKIEIGKGRVIQEGKQACILSLGTRLEECKIATERIKEQRNH